MWSKIVMGTAKLMGDKAALKALKEGEESGLKESQEALHDTTTPREVKTMLNSLLLNSTLSDQNTCVRSCG